MNKFDELYDQFIEDGYTHDKAMELAEDAIMEYEDGYNQMQEDMYRDEA